ncbi:MAG: two-component system, NtrC family, sensor kinase [Pyrinomonadaceae bacterium]|nr:two-component system, NtrC family, sensor kinase [Pyrinomonadaceae bacterium]
MPVSSIQAAKSFTLLIVDDDERARASLQHTFESAQHQVKTAADAPTALRMLHREPCDLILLDIELPGVDGLALCRLLRAQEATRRLPVIVISAHDDEERKVGAFAAGADDFIVKPATRRELLSRVGTQIEAAQRERALVGSNRELGFLADLGRGLLVALEPVQVVRRVAGATYEAANATLCAAILEPRRMGDAPERATGGAALSESAACVFDREGSAEDGALIDQAKLRRWLKTDPATSVRLEDRAEFFLRDEAHRVEYVAPLRFEGHALGALVVAFDTAEGCGETESRLIDAAAQQAALAARISSLYEAARASSASLAKEVERRTAEAEAQRRFTEAIIDTLPVSLYAVDRNHRIVAWNRNRELGGQGIPRGEALGRNIFDVLTRQRREILEREFGRAFETGRIERIEQESVAPDGTSKHWLVSKVPMRVEGGEISHVITVGEDITARVEANRAVARTEKLAAVGRLAAGVVHEINNPLATIAACAEALETRVVEGAFGQSAEVEDLREYLSLIRSEAFRCKTITNGLLDFSRNRAGQHAPVELGEVLEAAARLLRHQKRSRNVEIEVDAPADVAAVAGDAGQLQQAVIILAENAIDAMPQGGTLHLRAQNEGAAGVRVEVCDTGVGIPQENLARIFDPFFTTKEVGQGTGLGLAVCYGIVTEHGGRVAVDSVVGRGTTFTLVLPSLSGERLDDGGRAS